MHPILRVPPYLAAITMAGCGERKQPDTGTATLDPAEGVLTVVSYNVHGLPSLITGDDTPGRMGLIAPRLSSFDIIGLQEDFDADNHALLTAESTHTTQLWFNEMLPDRVYSSGLSLLAQAPLLDEQHQHYSTCHGVTDSSSDCLASKGFQVARLAVGSHSIDVYNTHLEAGGGAEDNAARQVQVDELIASLNGWSAGQAVIFTGDFNLRETDPEDLPLIEQLLEEADLTDSCTALDCDEPAHIDKVLYRASPVLELSPLTWENIANQFLDDEGLALSDHPAISTTFTWAVH